MWIKRPELVEGSVYVNLMNISDISVSTDGTTLNFWTGSETEDFPSIQWRFKTEQERDTYVKENLERYMEITV